MIEDPPDPEEPVTPPPIDPEDSIPPDPDEVPEDLIEGYPDDEVG